MSNDASANSHRSDSWTGNTESPSCLATLARECRAALDQHSCQMSTGLCSTLTTLSEHYDRLAPMVERVETAAPRFDFCAEVPANGYRSMLLVCRRQMAVSALTCRQLMAGGRGRRRSWLQTRSARKLIADLDSCCAWACSLCVLFGHLETLLLWSSDDDCLFPDQRHSPVELLKKADDVSQYCFYGRLMGLQFDESLRPVLQRIARFMCMYSHYFYNTGSSFRRWATASLFFRRIMNDPEYRAKRIVNISRYADIDFCKGFWSQQEGEFVQMYPEVVGPPLAVNITIGLPPEQIIMPSVSTKGATVGVEPPTAHLGPDSVYCRLLSTRRREGMLGGAATGSGLSSRSSRAAASDANLSASPYLVFHCHGGGFIAQSSKCHEVYLREWAAALDVPIFSVDYSLAPAAPFPRACQEVFFAYCWALKHSALLGSSAKRVLVVGDSAGGNLVTTVTLECVRRGVRPPDGQLLIYTPFNVRFVPSPARLQCLMDPLLPFGFLMRCLHAYAGHARSAQDGDQTAAEDDDVDAGTSSMNPAEETSSSTAATSGGVGEETGPVPSTASTVSDAAASATNYTLNPKRLRLGHRLANRDLDTLAADPLASEFQYFSVASDWRLSPYLADDALMRHCPRTHLLSCHMDPCLDDCVTMAGRWRRLNVPVHLTVLDGVCHGFLNFARFSSAAQAGSEACVKLLSQMLTQEQHGPL